MYELLEKLRDWLKSEGHGGFCFSGAMEMQYTADSGVHCMIIVIANNSYQNAGKPFIVSIVDDGQPQRFESYEDYVSAYNRGEVQ